MCQCRPRISHNLYYVKCDMRKEVWRSVEAPGNPSPCSVRQAVSLVCWHVPASPSASARPASAAPVAQATLYAARLLRPRWQSPCRTAPHRAEPWCPERERRRFCAATYRQKRLRRSPGMARTCCQHRAALGRGPLARGRIAAARAGEPEAALIHAWTVHWKTGPGPIAVPSGALNRLPAVLHSARCGRYPRGSRRPPCRRADQCMCGQHARNHRRWMHRAGLGSRIAVILRANCQALLSGGDARSACRPGANGGPGRAKRTRWHRRAAHLASRQASGPGHKQTTRF